MPETRVMLARLEAAGELPELLDAARDAFSLLLASCQDCEEQAVELFAAFAFAAAAAAEGWFIVDSALPLAGSGTETSCGPCVQADLENAADSLAGIAQVLGARLSSAARQALDPDDQDACERAATAAARVYQLLARDPR